GGLTHCGWRRCCGRRRTATCGSNQNNQTEKGEHEQIAGCEKVSHPSSLELSAAYGQTLKSNHKIVPSGWIKVERLSSSSRATTRPRNARHSPNPLTVQPVDVRFVTPTGIGEFCGVVKPNRLLSSTSQISIAQLYP